MTVKTRYTIMLLVLGASQLAACTKDMFLSAGYEALYQEQCLKDTGIRDCDPDHPSYDEYKKVREAELDGRRIDD